MVLFNLILLIILTPGGSKFVVVCSGIQLNSQNGVTCHV